jgi:hypothetical protein
VHVAIILEGGAKKKARCGNHRVYVCARVHGDGVEEGRVQAPATLNLFSVAYHVKNMTMAMGYCSVVAVSALINGFD